MGPEAEIETAVCDAAKAAGWKAWKLAFLTVNGAPDRIFGKGGRAVLIEFKAPGEEPTRQQYKRHDELREIFGFEVHWTDNIPDARRILGLGKH